MLCKACREIPRLLKDVARLLLMHSMCRGAGLGSRADAVTIGKNGTLGALMSIGHHLADPLRLDSRAYFFLSTFARRVISCS